VARKTKTILLIGQSCTLKNLELVILVGKGTCAGYGPIKAVSRKPVPKAPVFICRLCFFRPVTVCRIGKFAQIMGLQRIY